MGKIIKNSKEHADVIEKNHWLTPEITAMMDKIIKEKWFVREMIYPKEIKGCEIFNYNGCMRLYHNKDRFFALEGEQLNSEIGKNADFFSAEKIVIQQRDDAAFDHWQNESFDLASLWPGRQLVIITDHKERKLLAFAPVFAVYTPEFHFTKDMEKSYKFIDEFNIYRSHIETNPDKKSSPEALAFLRNSYNLLLWLKKNCH